MKPRVIALTLFALAGLVLWWRTRNKDASLDPETFASYKDLIGAFSPEAPTINERSTTDALPNTVQALTDGGWAGASIDTPEGSFSFTKPTTGRDPLYSAIEQAKSRFSITGSMLGQAIEQGSKQYAGRTDYLFATGRKVLALLRALIPDRVYEAQSLLSDRYKRGGYWLETGK